MSIYRKRIIAYLLLGGVVFVLGFFYDSVITKIIQPNVGLWISSSVVMQFWFIIVLKKFRDPQDRVLGIRVGAIATVLVILGAILIGAYAIQPSVRTAGAGVLCLCFALEFYLCKRESRLRYEADTRERTGTAQ